MRQPNPVQSIQQHVQRFGQQQTAELQVQQQMHELALDIYARAAADYLLDADDDRLRTLAAGSQRAARAFFEAMGVQFDEQA